jgi:hypothetical protein
MTPKVLLTLALTLSSLSLGGLASAIDVRDIPALPPGASAPAPRPTTPPATGTPPTTATPPRTVTLPERSTLTPPHRAELVGPAQFRAGQSATWTLRLTNTGETPLRLEYGACDLSFEVARAVGASGEGGALVRPAPQDRLCTLQLLTLEAAPGETEDVLKFTWDGRGLNGQALEAGSYVIRSAFRSGETVIRPADLRVQIVR